MCIASFKNRQPWGPSSYEGSQDRWYPQSGLLRFTFTSESFLHSFKTNVEKPVTDSNFLNLIHQLSYLLWICCCCSPPNKIIISLKVEILQSSTSFGFNLYFCLCCGYLFTILSYRLRVATTHLQIRAHLLNVGVREEKCSGAGNGLHWAKNINGSEELDKSPSAEACGIYNAFQTLRRRRPIGRSSKHLDSRNEVLGCR